MRKNVVIVATLLAAAAAAAQAQPAQTNVFKPVPALTCDNIPVADSGYTAHQAIEDSGAVYQQSPATYNDAMMRSIAYEYFSGPWRGTFVSGYGIYAMARAAIAHRAQLSSSTRFYIGCVMRDIRLHPETALAVSCGGLGDSCAEEYMGRALAFAAHDAWSQNYNQSALVQQNVDEAFDLIPWTTTPSEYSFMWYLAAIDQQYDVLFNHQTESPVYAMATIGHLGHIRRAYEAAGLNPPDYSYLSYQVRDTLAWIKSKIHPTSFEFRDAACGHTGDPWSDVCNCADRNEWVGSVHCNGGGVERHPKHYPMTSILTHLDVPSYEQWPWNAAGFPSEAACTDHSQREYNWVFNCLFP